MIQMKRLTTGLNNLDEVLRGGFPENSVCLISGSAGSGKTLFALNYLLEGAKQGEKGYYLSFNENKEELLRAANQIKSLNGLADFLDKKIILEKVSLGGKFNLNYFEKILSKYPQIDRMVIDNVNKLLIHSSSENEYRIKFASFAEKLKSKVKSSLILCETSGNAIDTGKGESFEADGVIKFSFLELEEKPSRNLEIHKMRYTNFDALVKHEYKITEKKIELTKNKAI